MIKTLLLMLALLLGMVGCASSESESGAPSGAAGDSSAWAGKTIGVLTGSICGPLVESQFPDAQVNYYEVATDCLTALITGKVDAWATDEPIIRFMQIENPGLEIVGSYLAESNLAAMFPRTAEGQALCDQYSAFVDGLWADGTMAQIDAVWFGSDEAKRTVPDYENLPAPNGTLRMAADPIHPPFTYMKDGRAVGYDLDVACRFCRACGYGLEIESMSFSGILPAVQSGKVDFAASSITVTSERAETVLFGSPDYRGGIVTAVWNDTRPVQAGTQGAYTSLAQLNGRIIGVQTGTPFDEMVKAAMPDSPVEYYNIKADMVTALTGHKVEAIVLDEPVAHILMRESDQVCYLPEYLDKFEFAAVFPKTAEGNALRDEFNAFMAQLPGDRLKALEEKWFGEDENAKTIPDIASLPAEKGKLRLATESGYMPFEYVSDGKVVGFDMELAVMFCQYAGYGLEIVDMNFDGILPSVKSGKCEFALSGISVTPERADSVFFSKPYFSGGTVAVVLKAEASATPAGEAGHSFLDSIWESFSKTFIRENRWQLFLSGVLTTLTITVLAILFGTALGFGLFMLCRNGHPVANRITGFCLWLVQGMPMVVLLMILYYIVFGNVSISGISVAVIGFTLTFGAAVFGLIRMGVGAVDIGQYEAAYAMGYSNHRTFFRIILPQALPHVLPAYKGEIVGLIKATAVVGYIAVQDLTKMGDIVRSRTYEAFFPLIAVTVIYFALEGLIGILVSRISVSFDPKRRKPADILKGVKNDDPN